MSFIIYNVIIDKRNINIIVFYVYGPFWLTYGHQQGMFISLIQAYGVFMRLRAVILNWMYFFWKRAGGNGPVQAPDINISG